MHKRSRIYRPGWLRTGKAGVLLFITALVTGFLVTGYDAVLTKLISIM